MKSFNLFFEPDQDLNNGTAIPYFLFDPLFKKAGAGVKLAIGL